MKKDLIVLAECVDARSGKRFQPGEEFDPAPSEAQAERLVAAGCLPKAAVDAARKADTEREKAEAQRRKKAEDAALLAETEAAHAAAEQSLADAEAALKGASDADKAEATKLRDAARKDVEAAAKKLAEMKK